MLLFHQPYERMKVCDALKSVTFQKDDVIVKRGDKAENMYFVEKGEVRVMRAVSTCVTS